METKKSLKQLPSMDMLLNDAAFELVLLHYSRPIVKEFCQQALTEIRANFSSIFGPQSKKEWSEYIIDRVKSRLEKTFAPRLKPVINATGIILHTGLGRAPLSKAASQNVDKVLQGYCNLELEMDSGKRGDRRTLVEHLICQLTGAEAAIVVNNNAAAVFLTLNTVAFQKEAVISRGQLVEIGGSFRIPDVMEKSGALMVEVGATNKTKLSDYDKAVHAETGCIVVAHTSNYRVMGFTAEVSIADIKTLTKDTQIPVVHDLGGGVLVDLRDYGLPYEPLVQDSLRDGADIVTFSGDKILGGPQCGIIAGSKSWITKIAKNPLMRAVRCDKMVYAALESTLQLYLQPDRLQLEHDVLRMLTEPVDVVKQRADKLYKLLKDKDLKGVSLNIVASEAHTGSGALPLEVIPSAALGISSEKLSTEKLAARLRMGELPIVGYVKNDKLYLDMRTVFDHDLESIADMLINLFQ